MTQNDVKRMNKKSPKNTIFRLTRCSHATVLSVADSGRNDTGVEEPEVDRLATSGEAELRERFEVGKNEASGGALVWLDDLVDAIGGGPRAPHKGGRRWGQRTSTPVGTGQGGGQQSHDRMGSRWVLRPPLPVVTLTCRG
jgi:hypothetical protein